MKLLLTLLLAGLAYLPATRLLLVDTNLKVALKEAEDFKWNQFLTQQFPIYAQDRQAIIDAAEKMAKQIGKDLRCFTIDSVAAGHSTFVVYADCQSSKALTVRLQTRINEQNLTCNFELVKSEISLRKAQKKLLDFATYLANK